MKVRILLLRASIVIVGALLAFSLRGVSPVAAAIDVDLFVSDDDDLECGGRVELTAVVTDNADEVADGTDVIFTIGSSTVATVETEDGEASIRINILEGFVGLLTVVATVDGESDAITISVQCPTAGPPASISLLITPATLQCGNQASILATVRDQFGNFVANGFVVTFISSNSAVGSIIPSAPTISGVATSVFTAFPRQSGLIQITAATGTSVTATGVIQITCPAAPAAPTQPAPAAAPPTVTPSVGIRPPSTGDAGLAR